MLVGKEFFIPFLGVASSFLTCIRIQQRQAPFLVSIFWRCVTNSGEVQIQREKQRRTW